jgi:hypothetical protein
MRTTQIVCIVSVFLLVGMPDWGLAAYGSSPANCEKRLRVQGITNQFEIHERCRVCFSEPSNPICLEPDTNTSNSGERSFGSSSSMDRGSSQGGENIQDYDRCLEKRVKRDQRFGNVAYTNRCHRQDIRVEGVCASVGLTSISGDDSLLILGGTTSDKQCRDR